MAFLTALTGPNEGQIIELDGKAREYIFGRHPDCHFVLDEVWVSRYHVVITVDDKEQFCIEDNKSRNGTLLNGKNLQERTLLKANDLIKVCNFLFLFGFETVRRQVEPAITVELEGSSLVGLGLLLEESTRRSSGEAVREVCLRLWDLLQHNHVHFPNIDDAFEEDLLSRRSEARRYLSSGFHRVVVLDAATGVGERGQFDLSVFLPFAVREMAAEFGFELHVDEYHPEEIGQILKDEARSLFCLLNIQVMTAADLRRLRGLTQDKHQILYCGPHDFERGEAKLGAILIDDPDDPGDSGTGDALLDLSSATGRLQFTASPQVKLEALMEITKNLSRVISLDKVLPGVLDSLFRIFMQADRGFVVLRDAKGTLVPLWTKVRRENASDQHRISRTIVDQVMETREAILSADAASDERFEMSQSIADFRIRSMMCAPLLDNENNAMGVLQVDTLNLRKRFQQEDLEVLANVATQSGIAIDNARMHEEALQCRAIDRDLEVAYEVQKAFLPIRPPQIEGYSFYDYYEPANTVGGDYFDYIELRDGRVAVLVADVVGCGIGTTLMMARVSAESRFSLANEPVVSEAVTKLNDVICGLNLDRFVTMIMVVIDPKTHEATIVNAGHMAPIWKKSTGEVEEPGLGLEGLPLGIDAGHKYKRQTIKLDPGDSLTLYTDGINECSNGDGMYGIERLHELVRLGDSDPAQLGDKIVSDVRSYLDRQPQVDDMCLIVLGRDRPS